MLFKNTSFLRRILKYFTYLLFYCSNCYISPTAYATTDTWRSWNKLSISGDLSDPQYHYHFSTGLRFHLNNKDFFDKNVNNIFLGKSLNNATTAWFGYSLRPLNSNTTLQAEQRFMQELIYNFYETDQAQAFTRTRLEQRWRTDESNLALRFRQKFLFTRPLSEIHRIVPIIFDELFFNLNHPSWVSSQFFSNNRFFFGFDFYITPISSFRLGYQNDISFENDGTEIKHTVYLELDLIRSASLLLDNDPD